MKLRELHLDDVVVIPGYASIAGGTTAYRDQSFHADDGWDLRETLPGVFSISREEMPHAVTVGGYGYSYVPRNTEKDAVTKAQDEYEARQDRERERAINEQAQFTDAPDLSRIDLDAAEREAREARAINEPSDEERAAYAAHNAKAAEQNERALGMRKGKR